jgi:hypothetical protein
MTPTLVATDQSLPFSNIPIDKVGYAFDIYDNSGNHVPHIIDWSNATTFNLYKWNGSNWVSVAGIPNYNTIGTKPSDLWDIFFDTVSGNSNNFSIINTEEYQSNTKYYNDLFGMYVKDFFRTQVQNGSYYAANTTSLTGVVEQWKIYLNNVGATTRVKRHSTNYFPTQAVTSAGILTDYYLSIPPYPVNPPSAINPGIPAPIDSEGNPCLFDPAGNPLGSILPYITEEIPTAEQIPGPLGIADPLNISPYLGPGVRERKKDGLWWTLLVLQNMMGDLNNLASAQSNEISRINDKLTASLAIETAISNYSQAMQKWVDNLATSTSSETTEKQKILIQAQQAGEGRRNRVKQQRGIIQQQTSSVTKDANLTKDALSNFDQLQNKIRDSYFNTNSLLTQK